MSLLSEEEFARKAEANRLKAQKAREKNSQLIAGHDTLTEKVLVDLQKIEADLDSLLAVRKEIVALPKEDYQTVVASLANDIHHYGPALKAKIAEMRSLIERPTV